MSTNWVLPEERSQEELRAARALLDAGLPAQAVSCAYFAGLHAAAAALLVFGETPSSQVGIVSAFVRRVVEDGLDPEAGRLLRKLFEDRTDIEFALASVPPEEARRAVADAELLLRLIPGWIEERVTAAA